VAGTVNPSRIVSRILKDDQSMWRGRIYIQEEIKGLGKHKNLLIYHNISRTSTVTYFTLRPTGLIIHITKTLFKTRKYIYCDCDILNISTVGTLLLKIKHYPHLINQMA